MRQLEQAIINVDLRFMAKYGGLQGISKLLMALLRLPTAAPGAGITFSEWADWFLENRSHPPFRNMNTHAANQNAMTTSEQQRIEFSAPDYLRNASVILVETGLRPYNELMPMKKLQVDMETPGGLYPKLQDSKRSRRDADFGFGVQGVPSTDRSDAGKRVSVSGATPKIQQAIHPITEEYLGRDTAACWRAAFPYIRVAPYVCDPAARRGSGGPFCHPDASAGRLGGIQALQPSEAQLDAGSAIQARLPG